MDKRLSTVMGLALVFLGGMAMLFTLVLPFDGERGQTWRLWPLTVVTIGVVAGLIPFVVRKRWMGALFIPAAPILATGFILLQASLFNQWHVWTQWWPLEVLALAVGFVGAAIYMRLVWLVIPAIIIGANGAILMFCALTGQWSAWRVLWTLEPLAVGVSLLVVGALKRRIPLVFAGVIVSALSGLATIGMLSIFAGEWPIVRWLGPLSLIALGAALLVWNLIGTRKRSTIVG